jgi:hypothetical protein
MILIINNLRRINIRFFNSILSARLISVLDFICAPEMWPIGLQSRQTELPTPKEGLTWASPETPRCISSIVGRRPSDTSRRRVRAISMMPRRSDCATVGNQKKINRRRGVLIRLIMFERAARRGFCENIIQSYQTTVLIEGALNNGAIRVISPNSDSPNGCQAERQTRRNRLRHKKLACK